MAHELIHYKVNGITAKAYRNQIQRFTQKVNDDITSDGISPKGSRILPQMAWIISGFWRGNLWIHQWFVILPCFEHLISLIVFRISICFPGSCFARFRLLVVGRVVSILSFPGAHLTNAYRPKMTNALEEKPEVHRKSANGAQGAGPRIGDLGPR